MGNVTLGCKALTGKQVSRRQPHPQHWGLSEGVLVPGLVQNRPVQLHPAGVWAWLEAPEPMFSEWGLGRGFPAAGPRAAPEKQAMQKEKRKKKNNEEKRMCCYF